MEITFIPSISEILHEGVPLDSIFRTGSQGVRVLVVTSSRDSRLSGKITLIMEVVGIRVSVTGGIIVATGMPKVQVKE